MKDQNDEKFHLVNPAQVSKCCAFGDAFLLNMGVKRFLAAPTKLFSSDLSYQQGVSTHKTFSQSVFVFCTILEIAHHSGNSRISADQQFLEYSKPKAMPPLMSHKNTVSSF